MQAVPQRDTPCELALRRELFSRGLRYRVDAHPVAGRRFRADVVVKKYRLVIFFDGCFWHGCPVHGTLPKANAKFWSEKLAGNVQRDRANTKLLEDLGWKVFRIWEHEDPVQAADRVMAYVEAVTPQR
jgi:DNA mismatch endonuclease (patch repair protein)